MKRINGYWVDKAGNRWKCSHNTQREAQAKSESLKDCRFCTDCADCKD